MDQQFSSHQLRVLCLLLLVFLVRAAFDSPISTTVTTEQHLSNHKSDASHNPSLKSCMIRIPGSYNSKCILSDGENNNDSQVKILQRWNGYRPKISLLLDSFYACLVDQKNTESQRPKYPLSMAANYATTIPWIEKLLQTPIADHRKYTVRLVLTPYLINIRRLSDNDALDIINNWLVECGKLRRLDNNLKYTVKYAIKNSVSKKQLPLRFDTLKLKNRKLYDLLKHEP
jgi:hypothetical protein